ncbi:MAG: autotransporter-associated beta strand repeat-containing protein [Pirellulales bacterium]
MRSNWGWLRAILANIFFTLGSNWTYSAALAESTWNSATGGSWLDATKWTGPIPNAPGDVAILERSPAVTLSVTLPSAVTVGQLTINGPSVFNVSGTGPLTFDQPGAANALVSVGGAARIHQLQIPIDIAAGEDLSVDIITGATLSLRGGLTGGAGMLTKSGTGTLELFAGNPAWNGQLVVNSGDVSVGNAASLGAGTGVAANGTRINAGGVLRFNALTGPSNELLQLDGGTIVDRSFGSGGNILGPIELVSSSTLRNSLGSGFEPTLLAGRISGAGALNLVGDFTLSGDNSYSGETILASGNVIVAVTSATGLGDIAAGTTVNANSDLRLDISAAEPLVVKGGRVIWRNNSQGWIGPVTVESGVLALSSPQTFDFPLILAGGGSLSTSNSAATWAGTVDGAGDLMIGGGLTVTGNLAHKGQVAITGATLNSANDYTGQTTIGQGTTTVNHALAFGSSNTDVVVESASANLVLNRSIDRDILVKSGNLALLDAATPFANVVRMQRGFMRWGGTPFAGTIALENDDIPAEVVVQGSTFNGQITGSGKLVLDSGGGTLTINGQSDYRGHTLVYGRVELNSANALGDDAEGSIVSTGTTAVRVATDEPLLVQRNGQLQLYTQLDRLPQLIGNDPTPRIEIRAPSNYSSRVDVRAGTLQIAATTNLDRVVMHDQGTLLVDPGRTLETTNDELLMLGGTVDGTIAGLRSVKKIGAGSATVRRMHNFQGEIEVVSGSLTVDELWASNSQPSRASPNRGVIRVTSRDAVLSGSGHVVDADVYLHDGGTLNSMVLLGDLYMGDGGGYVASNGTGVYLRGAVYGGDLVFPDDQQSSEVQITSDRAAYVGETLIRDGYLNLADHGRLTRTSRIVIGAGGQLLLNNSRSEIGSGLPVIANDRIADGIPVVIRGGELRMWSPSEGAATERIGRIDLERGTAKVAGQRGGFSPQTGTSALRVGELHRAAGATLFFEFEDPLTVTFDAAPDLDNGLLAPWATVNRILQRGNTTDFATYGPAGVQALTSFQQNLSAATANDNVLVSQNSTLPAGTTAVNSLTVRGDNGVDFDLAGQRLTIDSGGIVLSGNIVNGELAPGSATNELILNSGSNRSLGDIAAGIVDGAAGPTALTAASGKFTIQYNLSGANSYTGPTRVNNDAAIVFQTYDSLPAGGDMEINGGDVRLGYQSMAVKAFDSLIVRDGGRLTLQYPGSAKVDFETIDLESGSIVDVELVGDAAITKTGDGTATLSLDGRQFDGTIDVYEGTLIVEGSRSIGDQSVDVHGGRLVLQTQRNDSNLAPGDVFLNGGELVLDNAYRGTVFVNSPAKISSGNFSGFSRLAQPAEIVGASSLRFGGRIDLVSANENFTGDVIIEGRVVARHGGGFGSGAVTVLPGAALELAFPQGVGLPNDLILAGGELTTNREIDITPRPGRVLGKVSVTADSIISTNFRDSIEIAGPLELHDGVQLQKLQEGLLTISGDLFVHGNVDFLLGPGFLRRNDGNVIQDVVSQVQITGAIKSAAEHASINFQRSGFDDFSLTASVHVGAGQSLEILEDDVPFEFVLTVAATLSGSGTFLNPVRIDGGVLAPGQSPGTLSFADDLAIGAGTLYEWEINDASGAAGGSNGWDLLHVDEGLLFDASAADPLVIQVAGLNSFNQPGVVSNFDPMQTYRWLIAEADAIEGFDPTEVHFAFTESQSTHGAFRPENFSLRADNGNLFIDYQFVVPEPNAFLLSAVCIYCLALHAAAQNCNNGRPT